MERKCVTTTSDYAPSVTVHMVVFLKIIFCLCVDENFNGSWKRDRVHMFLL
jgi:hypothetical protein